MISCATCRHFVPETTFFGLIKKKSQDFALCGRAAIDGSLSYCQVVRASVWSEAFLNCDVTGRGWEPK